MLPRPRPSSAEGGRICQGVSLFFLCLGVIGCAEGPHGGEPRPLKDYTFERTAARVERGRYLASIGECFGCHSPIDSTLFLPLPGKEGSGDIIDTAGPVIAPNITPDMETGAGTWTDDMFVRAIREGFGHDGRRLESSMRSEYYGILTDEDVASLVVFLRSIPPIQSKLPKNALRPDQLGYREGPMSTPASPEELLDTLGLGKYLVRYARCEHCHSPMDSLGNRKAGLAFGGGTIGVEDSTRIVASKNLTQDPTGIPYYDETLFIQTIRTGRVGGVRELHPWMEWPYLRVMTDHDLKAVFRYLKTQPPVHHYVDNTEPPFPCKLCGTTHGLGNLN